MNRVTVYIAILAASLTAACFADAPPPNHPAQKNLDSDVALILDNPLPETEYSQKLRCLNTGTYRSVEVLDPSHLLFWGLRGQVWLNQLRIGCFGLTKDKILQFNLTGMSLCELDRFTGYDRAGRMGVPVAICGLQRFEVITEDQAKQLRDTLQRRAHTAAHVPTSPAEQPSE